MALYEWQSSALSRFLETHSLLCDVNVGAGKTFFAVTCVKELLKSDKDLRILVATPTIVLLNRNWHSEFIKCGFVEEDLGRFYSSVKEPDKKIVLTTYASLPKVLLNNDFDFIIFDEVHRCTSGKLLDIILRGFRYKLGLSATISRGNALFETIRRNFAEIYTLSSQDALSSGIMNEFILKNIGIKILDPDVLLKYTALSEKLSQLSDKIGPDKLFQGAMSKDKAKYYQLLNMRKGLVNSYSRKVQVCANLIRKNPDKKIIIFSETVKSLSYIQEKLKECGVSCEICHSKLSPKNRDAILDRYVNNDFSVLLTARMFDEGYNLPSIDLAIVYSGNSGYNQLKQRIGRSTRVKDDISNIYQLYLLETYEQRYVAKRTSNFKYLATQFEDIKI